MINPFRASFRIQFLLGFLACAGLLAYAFHTQFREVNPLEPCPLCIFQRIAFFALGAVFLLGALHAPAKAGWRRIYGVLALIRGHRGHRGAPAAMCGSRTCRRTRCPVAAHRSNSCVRSMGTFRLIQKVMTGFGRMREGRLDLPRPVDAGVEPGLADCADALGRLRGVPASLSRIPSFVIRRRTLPK